MKNKKRLTFKFNFVIILYVFLNISKHKINLKFIRFSSKELILFLVP